MATKKNDGSRKKKDGRKNKKGGKKIKMAAEKKRWPQKKLEGRRKKGKTAAVIKVSGVNNNYKPDCFFLPSSLLPAQNSINA